MGTLKFQKVFGREIKDFTLELAKLRIEVFRSFPYIYEGDLQYEEAYLKTYWQSDDSLAVLVFDDERVVGATTALPLAQEVEELRLPFEQNDYDLSKIMYFGESILLSQYRGRGVGRKFFEFREEHAVKVISDLQWTAFCAVERPKDHPLRPKDYQPLDGLWEKMGYRRQDHLRTQFKWLDLGETRETEKPMVFWTKSWNK